RPDGAATSHRTLRPRLSACLRRFDRRLTEYPLGDGLGLRLAQTAVRRHRDAPCPLGPVTGSATDDEVGHRFCGLLGRLALVVPGDPAPSRADALGLLGMTGGATFTLHELADVDSRV